jgi:glycosyltransferase involved in cell wall biosynthesis
MVQDLDSLDNSIFLSILIPTWNRRESVIRAITSAGTVIPADVEFVVVDNGSPPELFRQLSRDLECFPAVHLFRNDNNIGMVRNWNRCVSESRGLWMGLMCSDDVFVSGSFMRAYDLLKTLREPCLIIQDASINSTTELFPAGKATVSKLNLPIGSGNFWHRAVVETVGGFDERFEYSPDAEFWPRVALSFPVVKMKMWVAQYNRNETSYMWSTWRQTNFLEQTGLLIRTTADYVTNDLSVKEKESLVHKGLIDTVEHIIESTSGRSSKLDLFGNYFRRGWNIALNWNERWRLIRAAVLGALTNLKVFVKGIIKAILGIKPKY